MTRHAQVEGFADKLKLALGRANLSRAALAQQLGMDKSVVARWAAGTLHPADHSLAVLSAALGRAIPGFDGSAWPLSVGDFAARLGVAPAGRANPGASLPDSVLAFALDATAPRVEEAAATYAGLWLMLYPAMGSPDRLAAFAARLRLPDGAPALGFEFTNGGLVHARGHAFAMLSRLNCMFRPVHLANMIGAQMLDGVHEDKAEVLDGITLSRAAGVDPVIGAGRVIWLRLSDAVEDAAYAAAIARATQMRDEWGRLATPELHAAFARPSEGAFRQVRVAPAESWAISGRGLRLRPEAPHHAALAAIRAPFRGFLPGLPA